MRSRLLLSFVLAAGSLTACDIPTGLGDFCFMDGPCEPYPPRVVGYWVEGLPHDRVNFSGDGLVHLVPGDSVTLYLVSGMNGPPGADTVRTVTWGVTDGAVARITPGRGGSGAVVAIAPGIFKVTANGGAVLMFACIGSSCATIRDIRVVAPPAPRVSR